MIPFYLLPDLCRLAMEAGKAIMEVYETTFQVEYKEDKSPLTLADKRSNDIITGRLKKLSHFPIISEESHTPYPLPLTPDFWLVDPLDGTKEFIKRNGEFTVNIALIENKEPVLGVIYIPVTGQLYFAAKGEGAYLIVNCKLLIVNSFEDLKSKSIKLPFAKHEKNELVIVASSSHPSPKTQAFIDEQFANYKVKMLKAGSSIKFCLAAEGKADIYPRFAPTMEWDTAAGQIIATEAGKQVLEYETKKPMLYNKPGLLNGDFVVS